MQALEKRGIDQRALRKVMLDLGLSIVDISISMKSVYSENRKLMDSETPRVFFVRDPVWMSVEGVSSDIDIAFVPVHPDFPEKGVREIPIGVSDGRATIGIAQHDFARMQKGSLFRLKDLANFTVEKMKPLTAKMHSVDVDQVRNVSGPIIHWIPKLDSIPVELTLVDGSVVSGLGEPGIKDMKAGTFVQFERVGFAKLNEIGDTIKVAFAHK
jgi:glutamyl-tRNA synthetase